MKQPDAGRIRSTADARRAEVLRAGLEVFAENGYAATPMTDVAAAAGITQGYVQRLFGTKVRLFAAVVDYCYDRICTCLTDAADQVGESDPETALDAMGAAYAALIANRSLLMLQVHAQAATGIPEIRDAVRAGLRAVTELAQERSGADPGDIQRFMAFGQLCHLIATAGLDDLDERWALTLTEGMRHTG